MKKKGAVAREGRKTKKIARQVGNKYFTFTA